MTRLLPPLVAIALGLSGSIAFAAPPKQFPTFNRDSAKPALVVATVRPGKYLPQSSECSGSDLNTICLDPPPFWFKARIKSVIHGASTPPRLNVATTSHYGMSELELLASQPLLISLLTDGNEFVMPRYAMTGLTEDKQGNLYVFVLRQQPIWWLPCSVSNLRQEISPGAFSSDIEIPRDQADIYIKDSPELFRVTATGATPIYAIPLSRIGAHLDSLAPSASQMACEADTSSQMRSNNSFKPKPLRGSA
jgi:hypothetical protein